MAVTRAYNWDAPEVGSSSQSEIDSAPPIKIGMIGLGCMGNATLRGLLGRTNVAITALCDVDGQYLADATEKVAQARGDHPVRTFKDFRELNRCDTVDAVVISSPDHWHALQGIDALQSGMDAYIEKPLTLTVAEGRRLSDVARESGRICQTGSQQRSSREFRHACELVRNGYLGQIQAIELSIPPNNRTSDGVGEADPIPEDFDYDLWLGPAPWRPYYREGCHYAFRFVSDFSGGQMTNWGAHNLDIVQWALDADSSGPRHVSGQGVFPSAGLFDTPDPIDVEWTYADGVRVRCTTEDPRCIFTGSQGRIEVGRGHFAATPTSLQEVQLDAQATRLYQSDDHMGNFLECIRTRHQPVCPAEVGHRSATVCHIGNIAIRLGRPLEWDPIAERFVNDDEANTMLARPMRAPWSL
ncbi:MAG: Gfo/Idh/MocA family oxidoreductase [Lentisphaerae bacterium]|nr:Gfo/Idh/MocA family oxidoreductase [Lentisphaerota bacterium]